MSIPSNLVPKTSDSCSIKTSKGTLLVELWTNECPSTVDAFIECCKDHTFVDKFFYWNDDASYPCIILDYQLNSKIAPIPSEYHSRLAFSTDGILGWDTQKQTWFITSEQWLTTNKDNNVFGKVVGDSRYVLRDIIKGEKDPDDNSQYLFPPIIQSIEILSRNVDTPKTIESIKLAPKKHTQNVKLHFNTEDENDDEQDTLPILTGNKRNYLTEEGNDILNQTPKKMKIKLHKSITGNTSSGLSKKKPDLDDHFSHYDEGENVASESLTSKIDEDINLADTEKELKNISTENLTREQQNTIILDEFKTSRFMKGLLRRGSWK